METKRRTDEEVLDKIAELKNEFKKLLDYDLTHPEYQRLIQNIRSQIKILLWSLSKEDEYDGREYLEIAF
ncbi:MAG: hypothetical protein KAI71_01825 [Candidatus Pacebacteria bacterium]|nr:hypothetical protein [Candidatus Paceibacterota bacterium]